MNNTIHTARSRTRLLGILAGILCAYAWVAAAGIANAQGAAITPAVFSNGGENQTGTFGVLYSTIGEPLVGDSLGVSDDESTWTGFWHIIPTEPVSGVDEEWAATAAGTTGITDVSPNPFTDEARITVELARTGRATLAVYDLLGRVIGALVEGPREAGTLNVRWNPEGLEAGVYLLRLEVDGVRYSAQIIRYFR